MGRRWVRRAWVLAAVAGACLLLMPAVLLSGVPAAGALVLLVALPAAGLACAFAALRARERTAAAAVAVHAALLVLPWAAFAAFVAFMPEPCPTC
jgi:predicted ATPase